MNFKRALCIIQLELVSNLITVRTYTVKAINVGSFNLGEADRVLTIFSAEKGLMKAVAKGARKPGSKMSGRSDILCINELLLSPGRNFEIITQAQTIESFPSLRTNLASLTYGLYFAEITSCFGQGLQDISDGYYQFLKESLAKLARPGVCQIAACMEFEMTLLDFLGYKPELTFCIACREALDEYKLCRFNIELGGIVCSKCWQKSRHSLVRNASNQDIDHDYNELSQGVHITPLVWKTLILRSKQMLTSSEPVSGSFANMEQVQQAAQRILLSYIEQRAGKRFKTLDLLTQLQSNN